MIYNDFINKQESKETNKAFYDNIKERFKYIKLTYELLNEINNNLADSLYIKEILIYKTALNKFIIGLSAFRDDITDKN